MAKIKTGMCINFASIKRDIPIALSLGAESISLTGKAPLINIDIAKTAEQVKKLLEGTSVSISSVGVYGNPIENIKHAECLKNMILNAHLFGTDTVGTFTGAISGNCVEDCFPVFVKIFSEILSIASNHGVRICLENCLQKGTWKSVNNNIAFNPKAWEMIFDALPYDNLGLEWEPAHQVAQLINPVTQLKSWSHRIFHVHGKDAIINKDYIEKYGVYGPGYIAGFCNPGKGVTDWKEVFEILNKSGYKGSVSLEPDAKATLSSDVNINDARDAINYLKQCRAETR